MSVTPCHHEYPCFCTPAQHEAAKVEAGLPTTTLEAISSALVSGHESYPIHEAVAAYAGAHAGKRVTKRDAKKLEEAHPGWQFSVKTGTYSWEGTEIVFWKQNAWNETRGDLRVSQDAKNATFWTEDEVKTHTHNARYFKFAAERNAERDALLSADTGKAVGLAKAATLIDQIALLHAELKATIETYELDAASYKIREQLKVLTEEEFRL